MTNLFIAALLILPGADRELCLDTSVWLPAAGLTINGPDAPTEAEWLAVRHFNREIERFTGEALPVVWGQPPAEARTIRVGNRATLEGFAESPAWPSDEAVADADNQSYTLALPSTASKPSNIELIVAGLGRDRSPRGVLGLGYALGDLIRRLDIENGQWGFRLPSAPAMKRPAMENRTLYHMVSRYASVGLSMIHYSPEETEAYVDRLIDARYSRVTFWQYCDFVLYPGNREIKEGWREHVERVAQQMRRYLDYARRRGLEVYQMLTPAQVNLELLPNDPSLARQGFEGYGKDGVCWSQPVARDVARKVCQAQMEYFGPMDGYVVWFFDPAGCFCDLCRNKQAELMFDQVSTVDDLARTISPGSKLVACLWPTWCFAEYKLANYTEDEVKAFVTAFLTKCAEKYGPRRLTIMDMCEYDHTNIYNGWVSPESFRRSAFLYGATGFHGEAANAFAPLKLRYINEQMNLARKRGVEESMLYVYFEETNYPSVFVFADTLYEGEADWTASLHRYARTMAKGDAVPRVDRLLTALEGFDYAFDRFASQHPDSTTEVTGAMLRGVEETTHEERSKSLEEAEAVWAELKTDPLWFGSTDWLQGYVLAQHWIYKLAESPDEAAYSTVWKDFADEVATIPIYKDYMRNLISAPFARTHWPKR